MKKQVWSLLISIITGILSIAAAFNADLWWAAAWAFIAAAAWKCTRVWQSQRPIPMPHWMRWALFLPRGHSPQHLKKILDPRPGERILEIGPGIGIHALPVAVALLPKGILDVLDVQQAMIDDLKRRAAKRGVTNIVATHGDARELPYPDRTFDAAYMISALGEIPDQAASQMELRRVLKPAGRLVIGEVVFDPDYIFLSALVEKLKEAGFVLERTSGSKFSYFALFLRV